MTLDQLIDLATAAKAGKAVQYRVGDAYPWETVLPDGFLDAIQETYFEDREWRIKPTPREVWVNDFAGELSGRACMSKLEAEAEAYGRSPARQVRFVEASE